MLRSFTTASVLFVLAAASVGAQPVTRPELRAEMCGVTFVRAPDDVRFVIEQWLRAEPRCSSTIELRVLPTEGGLYLLAQRPDGRIHERFVPDAQTAGVLVASWVADDWTAPSAPPPAAMAPTPPPTRALPAPMAIDEPRGGAPGAVGVIAVAQPHARHSGKWLSLGMAVQLDNEGGGFRAEADVLSLGSWRLGAVVSYTETHFDLMSTSWDYGSLNVGDVKVMATLGRTWTWGRWQLRGGLGIGALYTSSTAEGRTYSTSNPYGDYEGFSSEATSAALELTGLVTRRIGRSWGIGVGPVLTVGETQMSSSSNQEIHRSLTNAMLFGGLRYEL